MPNPNPHPNANPNPNPHPNANDSMQAKRTRVNVVLLDCCREYVPSEYEITRAIGAEKLDPELMRGLNPQAPMVRLWLWLGLGLWLGVG